tara:strand:+ start:712 stop:1443 length:732 start_codon:yes stop_codon:yes gene_type:complete
MRITENRLKSLIRNMILESIDSEPWNSGDNITYYPDGLGGLLSFRKEVFSGQKIDYINAGLPESVANAPKNKFMFRVGSKIHGPSKIFKLIIGWHPPKGYENNPESLYAHEIIIDGPYTHVGPPRGLGKSKRRRSKIYDMGLIDYLLSEMSKDNHCAFSNPNLIFLHHEMRNKSSSDEKVGVFWDVWCHYDKAYVMNGESPEYYTVEYICERLLRNFMIEIKGLIIHEFGADFEDAARILGVK